MTDHDRTMNILRSFGVRWPDVMALLNTMKVTGGDPNGTHLQKAAYHFRAYVSIEQVTEREVEEERLRRKKTEN